MHHDASSSIPSDRTSGPSSQVRKIAGRNQQIDIDNYYEIHQTCQSIVQGLQLVEKLLAKAAGDEDGDTTTSRACTDFLCRVALQFPDSLLPDSADVCWKMEEGILTALTEDVQTRLKDTESSITTLELITQQILPNTFPLVFILGDTTFGSCCVDTVAAQHLRADWIVHYGPACLTPTGGNTPVSYVFGRGSVEFSLDQCVADVILELSRRTDCESNKEKKIVVLYDVVYHYAARELEQKLKKEAAANDLDLQVVMGQIPYRDATASLLLNQVKQQAVSCCGGSGKSSCEMSICIASSAEANQDVSCHIEGVEVGAAHDDPLVIGGLRIPLSEEEIIAEYTLLYIGGQETNEEKRHLTNILLRCSASGKKSPRDCWVYDPESQALTTDAPSLCRKQIQQRFYHVQKAKVAGIFGIVVAALTLERFRHVITHVQKMIEDAGRSFYTLAVGKINPSKLANFSEIECFVLVACPEHTLLSNPKDFHAPIITPLELAMALGLRVWDGFYSVDFDDFLACGDLSLEDGTLVTDNVKDDTEPIDTEEGDEPFFDVTTGKFASLKKFQHKNLGFSPSPQGERNLLTLPGQGQVTEYCSAAADVWKQREYQGLQASIGQTKVAAAKPGQHGIASDYGELNK